MRIAVFYNLNFGGAKRAAYEHVKRLRERGHLVDVYTTDLETDAFDFSKVSSNQFIYSYHQIEGKIPFLSRFLNDFKTFYFLNRLHKKIAEEIDNKKYDLVLAHPDKITQSPFLLRHLKTKSVYYCQEPLRIAYEYVLRPERGIGVIKYAYEQITRFIRKKVDIENVRSATFTVASCYHVRERMIEAYGIYPYVSYLGIDTEIFHPIKVKKKKQILFIGSKSVWNDGYDLVEKVLRLIPKNQRPSVKIISWKDKNNERLTDEQLIKEYNGSIVSLCLSRLETFGLVPLESMATGTPVIATKISGHRETIIDEQSGFLTDFDPVEIKEKLLMLINDHRLADKISKEARKQAELNWSWKKRIKELEKLLLKLAENK